MTILHQIENINKETEIIKKKKQMEILELENIITEMENSLEGLNGRSEQAEETIHELGDRSIVVT